MFLKTAIVNKLFFKKVNFLQNFNIDSKSGCLLMHGYYYYYSKNFPEGREQFTFSYDMFDIIIYGGISIKCFNDMWKFDSGILYI